MAQSCNIPCDLAGVERRIRKRELRRTMTPLGPFVGAGVILLLATPILIPLAGWEVAVTAALFFLLGVGVILSRALTQAGDNTRLAVPAELDRIIDEHESEFFPARLPILRATAASINYEIEAYQQRVGQFLLELREATGQAWRCPCRKRRLPLPF